MSVHYAGVTGGEEFARHGVAVFLVSVGLYAMDLGLMDLGPMDLGPMDLYMEVVVSMILGFDHSLVFFNILKKK